MLVRAIAALREHGVLITPATSRPIVERYGLREREHDATTIAWPALVSGSHGSPRAASPAADRGTGAAASACPRGRT